MLPALVIRDDSSGDGHFGTQRSRTNNGITTYYLHEGVDFVVSEGDTVFAPEAGVLVNMRYPYRGTNRWKGFYFIGDSGLKYTVYYATPDRELIGKRVKAFQPIAKAQDISKRYPHKVMTPHIHVEMRTPEGQLLKANEHLKAANLFNRHPIALISGVVVLIILIIFLYFKTR